MKSTKHADSLPPHFHPLPPHFPHPGELHPTIVMTHHLPLSEAAKAYKIFNEKTDRCIKVGSKGCAGARTVQLSNTRH